MNDRHKTKPKAVRMPGGLLAWYEQHAADTGMAVNAALVAALEEYRRRHSNGNVTIGDTEIGITVDDRHPPGIVSVISSGPEQTSVTSLRLADGNPNPQSTRKPRAKRPCEHRVQPGSYCTRCGRLI